MVIRDLGTIDFHEAFALQERLVAGVAAGTEPETLLLLEHPPVYTIGSGGNEANLLDPAIAAVRINRGGDVTWHGPGQLVGYPIVNLGRRRRDLHRYLRFLEELLIAVAADFRVESWRLPGRTGAWTEEGKLASIGVGVRRWVTMHGFALNVSAALADFGRINPCGIAGCPVSSLERECGASVMMAEVKGRIGERFEGLLEEWLPLGAGFSERDEKVYPVGAAPSPR
ncbi:MAG: lipoyl(octanoyl) transferase LipB [Geobacteraceae bacterium]|nr:lipoyl(octanoyl) transferase LipB [Geobacteraceae bacterium]